LGQPAQTTAIESEEDAAVERTSNFSNTADLDFRFHQAIEDLVCLGAVPWRSKMLALVLEPIDDLAMGM
jgi:hypothetical protein